MSGYFDERSNISPTEEAAKRNALLRNKLERKFFAGYDLIEGQIIDAQEKLNRAINNFENFNIDAVINYKSEIAALEGFKVKVADEYKFMFGVEFPTRQIVNA